MKNLRAMTVLALCAGVLLVSAPAFAWTCTAKNAKGANYTAIGPIKMSVATRAVFKCQANSAAPRTCVIVSCTPP